MNKIKNVLICILLIIFLGRCPPMVDFKELNFARKKPSVEYIVGSWAPNKETIKYIRDEGKYPDVNTKLIFRKDGTFNVVNMPDWWNDPVGTSKKKMISGNGEWQFEKYTTSLKYLDYWYIDLRFAKDHLGTLGIDIYGQKNPYMLFIRVGDPNSGNGMFFERLNLAN